MVHSLPTKPAFLGPPPAVTTLSLLPPPTSRPASSQAVGPSSSSASTSYLPPVPSIPAPPPQDPSKCALCATPPKYTCPRCSLRTCSLPCSTAHKEKYTCSGIRRAEGFVSLREYGQGEWAEDYRYLEEGRRKIEAWGVGVKEEDLAGQSRGMGNQSGRPIAPVSTPGRGGAGGRGGGMAGRMRKSKTHNLQMELRARGIWTEYMPEGMGRRRQNQSGWNKQTGILALTFQVSIPRDMLLKDEAETERLPREAPLSMDAGGVSGPGDTINPDLGTTRKPESPAKTHATLPRPASILTSDPHTAYHPRVLLAHPKTTPLPTLRSLLPAMSPSTEFVLLLPFFPSPARQSPPIPPESSSALPCRYFFPPLNPDLPLAEVLKGTAWVEFPTIHLVPRDQWNRGLEKGTLGIVPLAQPKKRGAEEMDRDGEEGGQRWGTKQDSGWGARAGKPEPKAAVPSPTKKQVKVPKPDLAQEALGALGAYASEEDEDEDEGENQEEGYMGIEPSEMARRGVPEAEDGLGTEDGVDEEIGEDDVIFGEQPGGAESLLAGLPVDLLVAMSHAIDADMA